MTNHLRSQWAGIVLIAIVVTCVWSRREGTVQGQSEVERTPNVSVVERLARLEAENQELWMLLLDLAQQLATVDEQLATVDEELAAVEEHLAAVEETTQFFHVHEGVINGLSGPHLIVEGCNVHVRNATGRTHAIDGTGNLIVGYNENMDDILRNFLNRDIEERTGSHNLIVGESHSYSSASGFVAGLANSVSAPSANVSGGFLNSASGFQASVSGGSNNVASGIRASVSGGSSSEASGQNASVSGGITNEASGFYASVSGGSSNEASGNFATVSGGGSNEAKHDHSNISGGFHLSTSSNGQHRP